MRSSSPWLSLVLLAPLALLGCDSGDGADSDGHDDGTTAHEGGDTHAETGETGDHGTETAGEEEADCSTETRGDEFAIGLSKSGELVKATFVSADPAPPIKGDNTWTLDITDLAGAPLDGLNIVVVPMMPDHGHGTPVNTEVMAMATPGQYAFSPVNLFMTGYWEITLELTLADGETDSLMFGFCVD